MNTLAIDTSQPAGSVALAWGGAAPIQHDFAEPSSHLVALSTSVSGLIERVGGRLEEIDRVALISGPGSFTGLRIGLAFVKGLYAARTLEIVVVNTLEMLALQTTTPAERICSMVDARKNEVYAAAYGAGPPADRNTGRARQLMPVENPQAARPLHFLTSQRVCPTLFVGSGARRYADDIRGVLGKAAMVPGGAADQVSTAFLCEVAVTLEPLPPSKILTLEPFYIRPSDAKLKPLRTIRTHD